MTTSEIFLRVGLAIVVGLLIGWERGWQTRDQPEGTRTAGIRTFTLVALLGGVSALLVEFVGDIAVLATFLGVVALIVVAYWVESKKPEADLGLTTEVALLLTFALGAYVTRGNMQVGLATAVIVVAILHMKPQLHHLIAAINRFELNSAIRLLVISAIMLPLLPNRGYGPGNVLNPLDLWWMVLLISALSFVGYFAAKYAPRRGLIFSGLLGGLASSTAVTVSLSRLAARNPEEASASAAGIGLASAMMFMRVIIIAGFFDWVLALHLVVPMLVAAIVTALGALFHSRVPARVGGDLTGDIGDPSDLWTAMKFGVVLVVVSLAAHLVQVEFGIRGTYGLAIFAGLLDVDAITISLARIARDQSIEETIVVGIALAAFTNTIVKIGIARWLGGADFGKSAAIVLGAGLVSGAVALILGQKFGLTL